MLLYIVFVYVCIGGEIIPFQVLTHSRQLLANVAIGRHERVLISKLAATLKAHFRLWVLQFGCTAVKTAARSVRQTRTAVSLERSDIFAAMRDWLYNNRAPAHQVTITRSVYGASDSTSQYPWRKKEYRHSSEVQGTKRMWWR